MVNFFLFHNEIDKFKEWAAKNGMPYEVLDLRMKNGDKWGFMECKMECHDSRLWTCFHHNIDINSLKSAKVSDSSPDDEISLSDLEALL